MRDFFFFETQVDVSRCPDMEGIETCPCLFPSLGAPDVSRCPDMEGIETLSSLNIRTGAPMSVGAPTWRGLKHSSESSSASMFLCQ